MSNSQDISTQHNHKSLELRLPGGLRHFTYWVAIFVIGQALQRAFLTSWQQGAYNTLDTAWANAALLFGVVILWFFIKWGMGYKSYHSGQDELA